MESKRDDLQSETDVPYVPNVRPVIVPPRIGSNVVNLSGDLEAEIKSTHEADAEKKARVHRKRGTTKDPKRRFGQKQK